MNSQVAPGQLLLTLHGSVALSPFRVEKLVAGFKPGLRAAVAIETRFVHFALLAGPLTDAESEVLGKILTYGTPGAGEPKGELRVVLPRFGTVSPVVLEGHRHRAQLRPREGDPARARRGVAFRHEERQAHPREDGARARARRSTTA